MLYSHKKKIPEDRPYETVTSYLTERKAIHSILVLQFDSYPNNLVHARLSVGFRRCPSNSISIKTECSS